MKNTLSRLGFAEAIDNYGLGDARAGMIAGNDIYAGRRLRLDDDNGGLFLPPVQRRNNGLPASRWLPRPPEGMQAVPKDAATSARQALRLLQRFNHDIRTPLNSIIGFATLIEQDETLKGDQARCAGYGRDIADAGMELLETTLEHMTLLETVVSEAEGQYDLLCVNGLVDDMLAEIKGEAVKRRVITRASLADALPPAFADHNTVRKLLRLLVERAIEVTPPYGQILIATRVTRDGCPVLSIRDGGERLSADQISEIASLREDGCPDVSTAKGPGRRLLIRALVQTEVSDARLEIQALPERGNVVDVTFRSGT